ncbi:MAG: Sensor histidine kinase RcsC [Chlamydiales bacterium]|nr:Sensor histidine kinase RcsC [Chlamydiales bacterium]MCH9619830.1 Sensor histidine kinase RcsC [Chlamydiales bacterium]MCH9622743.1 Sensor histidine kinase RcsC [Chlamydiales bacterium]
MADMENKSDFLTMFNAVPALVLLLDSQGNIISISQKVIDFLGYTLEEVLGKNLSSLFSGDDKGYSFEKIVGNNQQNQQYSCSDKKGNNKLVKMELSSIELEGEGRFIASLSTADEPFEDKLTFVKILNAAPNAMVLVDEKGEIVFANDKLEELFGYTKEEMIGKKVEVLLPENIREKHVGLRDAYISQNPTTRMMGEGRELFGKSKTGKQIPVEIGLGPTTINDKPYVIATIVDITERKQRQELFQKAIEASPTAMLMVNQSGVIVFSNARVTQMFGYDRSELIGQPIEMLLPESLKKKHVGLRDGYIARPEPRQMGMGRDLFGIHKFGYDVPVEIGLNPLKIGDEMHVIAGIIDISQRKQQNQKIDSMIKELERSNKELEEFAYVASHDLQEPIRKVQSFGDLLLKEYGDRLDGEAKEYIKHMSSSILRMRRLINDLLAFSRLSTQTKEFTSTDLNLVLTNVLSDLEEKIKTAHAEIEADQLITIDADETQMHQLFQNFITNALKFHKADVNPVIKIRGRVEDEYYVIDFKDNGIGFEMEFVKKIFTIFQRLNSKEAYEGTGIGLAMCKKIVERHEGQITVLSEVGEGIIFTLKLPIKQRAENNS